MIRARGSDADICGQACDAQALPSPGQGGVLPHGGRTHLLDVWHLLRRRRQLWAVGAHLPRGVCDGRRQLELVWSWVS